MTYSLPFTVHFSHYSAPDIFFIYIWCSFHYPPAVLDNFRGCRIIAVNVSFPYKWKGWFTLFRGTPSSKIRKVESYRYTHGRDETEYVSLRPVLLRYLLRGKHNKESWLRSYTSAGSLTARPTQSSRMLSHNAEPSSRLSSSWTR